MLKHFLLQWGKTQEERANIITAVLKNPTPNVSKAIAEAKAKGKGVYPILSFISPQLFKIYFSFTIFS